MRRLPRLALLECLIVALACAQNVTSFLKGTVTDRSGAGVPGADCVLIERRIGRVLTAASWIDGSFRFANIAAGDYDLKVRARGFKVLVLKMHLRVSETVELKVVLDVGNVTERVEVKPEPALLDTAPSTHSHVIDGRRILDLPVSGGNPVELTFLAPGLVTNRSLLPMKAAFNATAISADGSPAFTNEFQLDGVSNTFADGAGRARDAFRPPPTAIGEFKVQSTPYDASVGRTIGAVISVTSASGTNELHGEAHYWAKNSAFDAPDFFNNKNHTRVAPYADHRYGASAGGPLRLPKLYEGANRTFWYHAWEANKWGMPQTFTGTVPSEAERGGDFSELLRIGRNYQIYDPLTTAAAPGGRFTRLPLPGNVIPRGRLDRVGSNLASLYPLPNQPGRTGGLQNFFHSSTAKEDYRVHLTRVDHAFSAQNRAFLRVHYDHWVEDKNDYYGDGRTGIILMRINRGLALNDVHVFNPSLALNLRYGVSNQEFPERRVSRGYDLGKLGFSKELIGLIDGGRATIPRFNAGVFSSYSSWETGDGTNSGVTHTAAGALTWFRGAHVLNVGADVRVYRAFGARFPYSVSPDFSFSSVYTRGPMDNSPAAPAGQELAAMLFGIPAGSMAVTASSALQDKFLGLFLQDDFKVTRGLTLNLGLRYEVEAPMTERFDRLVAGFAFGEANPIEAQARANYEKQPIPGIPAADFRVSGGQAFVNERGVSRSPFRGERNNFLPRFGFAWQLRPGATMRGGYGIYYDSLGVNAQVAIQSGFSQTTPIQASLDNGLTFAATNANPFPRGLIGPAGPKGGLRTNLGQAISFYDRDLKHAYSQRWSLGFQQLLPGAWLLDTAYLANRATRLAVTRSLNETPARFLSTQGARDQETIDYLTAAFANPFQGIDPIYGANISRGGDAAAVSAVRRHHRSAAGGLLMVSLAANTPGKAALPGLHAAAFLHVVEADDGDGLPERVRRGACRGDRELRPAAPFGHERDLGDTGVARTAFRRVAVGRRGGDPVRRAARVRQRDLQRRRPGDCADGGEAQRRPVVQHGCRLQPELGRAARVEHSHVSAAVQRLARGCAVPLGLLADQRLRHSGEGGVPVPRRGVQRVEPCKFFESECLACQQRLRDDHRHGERVAPVAVLRTGEVLGGLSEKRGRRGSYTVSRLCSLWPFWQRLPLPT